MLGEVLHMRRELRVALYLLTTLSSAAVFQGAICLTPGRLVPVLRIATYQSIGVALADGVEHCVISAADGAAQVSLNWIAFHKTPSNIQ